MDFARWFMMLGIDWLYIRCYGWFGFYGFGSWVSSLMFKWVGEWQWRTSSAVILHLRANITLTHPIPESRRVTLAL